MRLIEIDKYYSPLTNESFIRDLQHARNWHPNLSPKELRTHEKQLSRWDKDIKRDYTESDIEIPPQYRSDDYEDYVDDEDTERHLLDIELAQRGIKQRRKKLPRYPRPLSRKIS